MSDDPYGLGIAGIGYGGFAEGFSANGVDLSGGLTAGIDRSASQSSSAYRTANAAQRKKLLSDLVELMERHRAVHSFDSFVALSTIDLGHPDNAKLLEDLGKNTKVTVDTTKRTIAYKPTLPDVHNRADILRAVQQHPFGLSEEKLLDAYHGVQDDIRYFVEGGQIYHLSSSTAATSRAKSCSASSSADPPPPTAAPSPASLRKDSYSLLFPRLRHLEVPMDPALVHAWHTVSVPYNAADLDDVLVRAGLMSERQMKAAHLAKSALAKLEIKQKRKRKEGSGSARKRYRQNLTNTHLVNQQGYQWLKQQQSGKK